MLNNRTAWFALAFPVLVAGCEGQSSAAETMRSDSIVANTSEGTLLRNGPLTLALQRLHAKAKDPILALSLTIKPSQLVLQAQDPDRPSRVLEFLYRRGRVGGVLPVELRGSGKLEENLFPLADVKLGAIEALTRTAIERVDPQDGKVREIIVRRNLPFDRAVQIRVYVDSPRRNGYLDASQDGRPLQSD